MSNPNTTHAQYDEMSTVWRTCRDATVGQRKIHASGTLYLPKLSSHKNNEDEAYKAYLKRALYFNATGRTVEALRGLVFRKNPVVNVPKGMEEWLKDITLTGRTLDGLSRDVMNDALVVGRCGLLVDHPPQVVSDAPLTSAQAQSISLRPYITMYSAEEILNWELGRVGLTTKLIKVMLDETFKDEITGKIKKQVRELSLDMTVPVPFYQQIVWRKKVENGIEKDEWEVSSIVIPVINQQRLSEIPFFFVGPQETTGDVSSPPIEDMAYINISHYMNSADLENGAHVSGLPTPYVTGVTEADELHIGSNTAWILPDANCKAGFAQVGSEGFASLEKLMDRKEQQMAALGARLIAPEKKAAETAETASIRRGGESSVLSDIAGMVQVPITKALAFMAKWAGLDGDVSFELNRDYLVVPMTPQTLTALLAAVQSGNMSQETFFECLKAGEVVSETLTFEDEQDRIATDGPSVGSSGSAVNANGQ